MSVRTSLALEVLGVSVLEQTKKKMIEMDVDLTLEYKWA